MKNSNMLGINILENWHLKRGKKGKMDLALTMTYAGNIIFELDGEKISYGYIEYNGKNWQLKIHIVKSKKI